MKTFKVLWRGETKTLFKIKAKNIQEAYDKLGENGQFFEHKGLLYNTYKLKILPLSH